MKKIANVEIREPSAMSGVPVWNPPHGFRRKKYHINPDFSKIVFTPAQQIILEKYHAVYREHPKHYLMEIFIDETQIDDAGWMMISLLFNR